MREKLWIAATAFSSFPKGDIRTMGNCFRFARELDCWHRILGFLCCPCGLMGCLNTSRRARDLRRPGRSACVLELRSRSRQIQMPRRLQPSCSGEWQVCNGVAALLCHYCGLRIVGVTVKTNETRNLPGSSHHCHSEPSEESLDQVRPAGVGMR